MIKSDLMKELTKVQAVWGEALNSKIENSVDEYIELMHFFAEQPVSSENEKAEPKKLHIVELKDGRVLDVPFGKLVIASEFKIRNSRGLLNFRDLAFVLESDIRMIQNVEV